MAYADFLPSHPPALHPPTRPARQSLLLVTHLHTHPLVCLFPGRHPSTDPITRAHGAHVTACTQGRQYRLRAQAQRLQVPCPACSCRVWAGTNSQEPLLDRGCCSSHSRPGRRVMMPTATVRPPSRSATRPSACSEETTARAQVHGWLVGVGSGRYTPRGSAAQGTGAHTPHTPHVCAGMAGTAQPALAPSHPLPPQPTPPPRLLTR